MSELLDHTTVGDIVAADFRTAACSRASASTSAVEGATNSLIACRQAAADPAAVRHALDALPPVADRLDDMTSAPLEQLIEHIVETHHGYVRSALPAIAGYLEKLVEVHGARHPELARVLAVFRDLRADFEQHLMKEEQVLFPYVRDLATRRAGGSRGARSAPSKTRSGCWNASISRRATKCARSVN